MFIQKSYVYNVVLSNNLPLQSSSVKKLVVIGKIIIIIIVIIIISNIVILIPIVHIPSKFISTYTGPEWLLGPAKTV